MFGERSRLSESRFIDLILGHDMIASSQEIIHHALSTGFSEVSTDSKDYVFKQLDF